MTVCRERYILRCDLVATAPQHHKRMIAAVATATAAASTTASAAAASNICFGTTALFSRFSLLPRFSIDFCVLLLCCRAHDDAAVLLPFLLLLLLLMPNSVFQLQGLTFMIIL